mmetsp:Transcript_18896/g.39654  ORF Transcript_18896/g.39654 Transcript_18896/m.39654 type:complete len:280 (+) Transcript_18896:264-1103(+)
MKANRSILYYSSLPNEAPPTAPTTPSRRKDAQQSQSPRKTMESAQSSISNVVSTSVNSARKIKVKACSFGPMKKLSAPTVPISKGKKGRLDEVTPVIFYPDEDVVVKGEDDTITLVDPFSFEGAESPDDEKDDHEDSFSPSSVVPLRLFPGRNIDSGIIRKEEDDVFKFNTFNFDGDDSFDRPIFAHDFNYNEDDTSIDLSEAIKSINDLSTLEGTKAFIASIRAKNDVECKSLEALWQDTKVPWDGFQRSPSFTTCEWDPKTDDSAVPSTLANSQLTK